MAQRKRLSVNTTLKNIFVEVSSIFLVNIISVYKILFKSNCICICTVLTPWVYIYLNFFFISKVVNFMQELMYFFILGIYFYTIIK